MKAIWDRPEDKALTLRSRIRRGLDQGSLPAIKEHGQTFRRNEIAKAVSASARIGIARAQLDRSVPEFARGLGSNVANA
jgi:hypothetical protein